jgi:cell division protein FtsQ
MSRSIAAPSSQGRASRSGRGPRASARTRSGPSVPRALAAGAGFARSGLRLIWQRRRLRIALLALVAALPFLGGGWLLLRRSSFVAVHQVRITGVHGAEARAVQSALEQSAHGMSTLDVSPAALRAAVAPLRVVRSLRVVPHFPHGLVIEVSEQLPVAALTVAGVRTAVAADGVVLGPRLLSASLPTVSGWREPALGEHVSGPNLRAALSVLGAAPASLAKHVERVFVGVKGLTVAMHNGLLVYFGDATRPHAKWLSLARVLADSSSAGAAYVDVRVPGHPAAGFPAGVLPPSASANTATATGEPVANTESTIASLAAGLTNGTAVSSSGEPPAGSAAAESAAGSSSEASSGEGTESEAGTGAENEPGTEAATSETGPTTGG